jgi:murein DD-endopeptidase MepM/ murein hydrolase activator NlpD
MPPSETSLCASAHVNCRLSRILRFLLFAAVSTLCANALANSAIATLSDVDDPQLNWKTWTVKSGDTLSGIALKYNIGAGELHRIINAGNQAKRLARIKPGDEIHFAFAADNSVQQLVTRIDEQTHLSIQRTGAGFSVSTMVVPLERRVQYATGTITNSLFGSARASGISQFVIMNFAALFGWDIDFNLDVRKGDQFSIVYESFYRNGEHVRDGGIVVAEYINNGNSYRAVRYTDPDDNTDHYSPDGKTLRKAFLRSPIAFARVSSGFNLKRKHPVLHKIRAHKGVDYAAKTGTPIRATGDGKVVRRGHNGGYGRRIVLKHGSRYSTLYAHMSRYASNTRPGSRVIQGQVIGYAGRSGLATGTHLHYEFRADGVHRNPLRFRFPGVAPVPEKYHDDFAEKTVPLFAQLDLLGRNQVALSK